MRKAEPLVPVPRHHRLLKWGLISIGFLGPIHPSPLEKKGREKGVGGKANPNRCPVADQRLAPKHPGVTSTGTSRGANVECLKDISW